MQGLCESCCEPFASDAVAGAPTPTECDTCGTRLCLTCYTFSANVPPTCADCPPLNVKCWNCGYQRNSGTAPKCSLCAAVLCDTCDAKRALVKHNRKAKYTGGECKKHNFTCPCGQTYANYTLPCRIPGCNGHVCTKCSPAQHAGLTYVVCSEWHMSRCSSAACTLVPTLRTRTYVFHGQIWCRQHYVALYLLVLRVMRRRHGLDVHMTSKIMKLLLYSFLAGARAGSLRQSVS